MTFEIHMLDLLGTFTFAFYGAHVGIRRKFDIFGIFAVAFLTALGGGTIREIILNHVPRYFIQIEYVVAIILGMVVSILLYKYFSRIQRFALIVDAIGLATFAFIGAEAGAQAGLGVFGIILLSTVTAVGGGLLRDIAIAETPQIFYKDFYASPAIILGTIYAVFFSLSVNHVIIYCLIALAFIIRVLAIYFNLNLWAPWRKGEPISVQDSI